MGTPELFDEMGQLNKKDIQVIIADDNMSATLFLSEPAKEEDPYTYEEVMRALSNAGVKMGLDDARIHHMVEEQIYNTAVHRGRWCRMAQTVTMNLNLKRI